MGLGRVSLVFFPAAFMTSITAKSSSCASTEKNRAHAINLVVLTLVPLPQAYFVPTVPNLLRSGEEIISGLVP